MIETVIAKSTRRSGAVLLLLMTSMATAAAQPGFQPPSPPGAAPRSQTCLRLESQLAGIDRGAVDPARADQIKRYEETIARQQADLDRLTQQASRTGCQGSGFFALFSGQPAQCGPINNQIQQVRANLDRLMAELQRVQGNSADREAQRRSILVALGQSDCGPQYRQYATAAPGGGFFETLFGGSARREAARTLRFRGPTGPCACAPATATTSRFPTPRCRASSPRTNGCASGCARPAKPCSTAIAIPART